MKTENTIILNFELIYILENYNLLSNINRFENVEVYYERNLGFLIGKRIKVNFN